MTPATPTTFATTETSADPAAATLIERRKKVALVLSAVRTLTISVLASAQAQRRLLKRPGFSFDVLNASDFVDPSKGFRLSFIKYDACIVTVCRLSWLTIRHLAKLASPLSHMTLWLTALISAPVLAVTTMFSAHRLLKRQSSTSSLDEINGEVICLNCRRVKPEQPRLYGHNRCQDSPELTVNEQKLGGRFYC